MDAVDEAVDFFLAHASVRMPVAALDIGTIVSYQGRLYVVLGTTPMSVNPPLVELEDTENGDTRRVQADDPELVVEVTKGFQPTTHDHSEEAVAISRWLSQFQQRATRRRRESPCETFVRGQS
jgi:hypothetical protein